MSQQQDNQSVNDASKAETETGVLETKVSRRFFLGGLAGVSVLSTLRPLLAGAEEGRRGGAKPEAAKELKVCSPDEPALKAISYVPTNSKITDPAMMADREGVKFKDQKCNGCQFFEGKASDKAAKCTLAAAATCGVAAAGWCPAWKKRG